MLCGGCGWGLRMRVVRCWSGGAFYSHSKAAPGIIPERKKGAGLTKRESFDNQLRVFRDSFCDRLFFPKKGLFSL